MTRKDNAERNAAQPMAGQPRADDEEEGLESPERVPSLLTARELQARDPAKAERQDDDEPALDDDEPPPAKPAPKTRPATRSR